MDHKQCLEEAQRGRPSLRVGEGTSNGRFWRNLPRNELAPRYDDKSVPPKFGYRIKCGKWTNIQDGGLSVNSVECACALCSVLLTHESHRYEHAVCISLELLTEALGFQLVATYDPLAVGVPGAENPCHFTITPTTETLDAMVVGLKHLADRDYPSERPRNAEDERRCLAAQQALELIFELRRNVRSETAT